MRPSWSSSMPLHSSACTAQAIFTCDQVAPPLLRVGSGTIVATWSTESVTSVNGGKDTPSKAEYSIRSRGSKSPSFLRVISVKPWIGLLIVNTVHGNGSPFGDGSYPGGYGGSPAPGGVEEQMIWPASAASGFVTERT